MENKKFIITKDKDVAEALQCLGYIFVNRDAENYIYVNNSKLNFEKHNIDKSKVFFTNIIHF